MNDKPPTHTCLVFEVLCDNPTDFMNISAIAKVTGSSHNQVSAALFSLRKRRAVDVVIEKDGTGWWFATPEADQRIRHVDNRVIESKPRRHRRARIKALGIVAEVKS